MYDCLESPKCNKIRCHNGWDLGTHIGWKSCYHGPLARYVILRVAHAPGMPGKFSPPPRFSDPDMHHGTCVTHVPWCMSGSLTSSFLWSRPRGKTFPAFPAHAQPAILRIWQEAHEKILNQMILFYNVRSAPDFADYMFQARNHSMA